jgi:hypothetical protein
MNFVGFRTRNTENVQAKVVGISLRRRDHFKSDMVWFVLGKVIQSNARFDLNERLEIQLDNVRVHAGNGKIAEKTRVPLVS